MQGITPASAPIVDELAPAYVVDSPYQRRILAGLNITGKHVYAGTVPAATIAKRRAANKAARQARKAARK